MERQLEQHLGGPAIESVVASVVEAPALLREAGRESSGEQQCEPSSHRGYVLIAVGQENFGLFDLRLGQWQQSTGRLLFGGRRADIAAAGLGPGGLSVAFTLDLEGGAHFRFDVPRSQLPRLRRLVELLRN